VRTRHYSLYFDAKPINLERVRKRAVAAGFVALHLLLIWLAMRSDGLPPRTPDQSLILVEMNMLAGAAAAIHSPQHGVADSGAPHHQAGQSKTASGQHSARVRSDDSQRPLVTEGQIAPNDDHSDAAAGPAVTASGGHTFGAGGETGFLSSGSGGLRSGHFSPPRVQSRWVAPYPLSAFNAHAEGEADVLVTVDALGHLVDAQIERSSGNAALDEATLEAVRRYTFRAALQDGSAIQAQGVITIEWHITPGVIANVRARFSRDTRDQDVRQKLESIEFLRSVTPDSH